MKCVVLGSGFLKQRAVYRRGIVQILPDLSELNFDEILNRRLFWRTSEHIQQICRAGLQISVIFQFCDVIAGKAALVG